MVLNKLRLISVITLLTISYSSFAVEENRDTNVQVFGTFTSTLIDTNNTALYDKKGTTLLNQLTLHGSYEIFENTSLLGAINTTNAYGDKYDTVVDYLFLQQENTFFDLFTVARLGRTKLNIGLFEQERNNPVSRPTIFLPFATYWPALTEFAQAADGVQFEIRKEFEDIGGITLSSTYGNPVINSKDEKYIAFGYFHHFADNNAFEGDGPLISNTIQFQTKNLTLKYNHTTVNINHNINPHQFWSNPAAYTFTTPNLSNQPIYELEHKMETYGIRYEGENFCLGMEIVKHHFPTKPIGKSIRGCYDIRDDLRVLLSYSKFKHENNSSLSPTPVPEWYRQGESHGVGFVWNATNRTTIKAEYQKGTGTGWFPFPASSPDWEVIAISVSYKFDLIK